MGVRVETLIFCVAVCCLYTQSVYGFKSWSTNPWLKFKSMASKSGNAKRTYNGYGQRIGGSQSLHADKVMEACDTQCWTNLAVCFQQSCDYGSDSHRQEACSKYCWAELKPCLERC